MSNDLDIATRTFAGGDELERAVAAAITAAWTACPAPSAVLLPGGSTPQAVYACLAAHAPLAAPLAFAAWTDDRLVPVDSPASNYGRCRAMLDRFAIPRERRLRVRTDLEPRDAADRLHHDLDEFLADGGRFPLGFLGLGEDGHTCSLFDPATASRRDRFALLVHRPDYVRVTVTAVVLARVDRLIFLVRGADKRPAIEKLLHTPSRVAAGIAVTDHPNLHLWTDLAL